jgi:hypothetical protein
MFYLTPPRHISTLPFSPWSYFQGQANWTKILRAALEPNISRSYWPAHTVVLKDRLAVSSKKTSCDETANGVSEFELGAQGA